MDAKKIAFALAGLALSTSLCFAGHTGKIRFIGQVVEAGCWNVTGTHDVTCQHNNATSHYRLVSGEYASLPASNASAVTRRVDNNSQLALMQITYD